MLSDQRALVPTSTSSSNNLLQYLDEPEPDQSPAIREIHALTPPPPPPAASAGRSPAISTSSTENFSSMSREFNALVLAGSAIGGGPRELDNIREEREEETYNNPLAIVPDSSNPVVGPTREVSSMQRVKKEEVETKIGAWQNAKIAKINNRFKREDVVINGWEEEQVQKANTWMKKVESGSCFYVQQHLIPKVLTIRIDPLRKLEEKRAKALEKMQNDIAKAHRKAEERRASAEAKRGTKVARVLEVANLMRAVGRAPVKRSFF
ncbi:remorin family protein [Striga asiatica]|uniref:Remorin family protein n=1 Tax=Striga asiatica TaxID=4170 RepID=A0A5A7R4Y4_STRAF|nr:remorin family protein [Striga asiatica]